MGSVANTKRGTLAGGVRFLPFSQLPRHRQPHASGRPFAYNYQRVREVGGGVPVGAVSLQIFVPSQLGERDPTGASARPL